MSFIGISSEHIRKAIKKRIELKKRRNAAKNLLNELKEGKQLTVCVMLYCLLLRA